MVSLRTFALVFALLAAASLSAGTTGFSALSAERSVNVAVVEDDRAYVGVDVCDPTGNEGSTERAKTDRTKVSKNQDGQSGPSKGGNMVFVRVSNKYTDRLHVSLATDEDTIVGSQRPVTPGTVETFNLKLDDVTDSVTVEVTAAGFEASITRPVERSTGCGNGGSPKHVGQQNAGTQHEADTEDVDDAEVDDEADDGDEETNTEDGADDDNDDESEGADS
jgi:hypothetical protein